MQELTIRRARRAYVAKITLGIYQLKHLFMYKL